MAVKQYKPTTSSRRFAGSTDFSSLSKKPGKGFRKLLGRAQSKAGRNNTGKITVRHRGSGVKQKVRIIDFSRTTRKGMSGVVKSLDYDPTRTAFLAQVAYRDGVYGYVLAPQGLKVGDKVLFDDNAEILPGSRLPLKHIPVGTLVHDIELAPGNGGKIARGAGSYAILQTLDEPYALLKLPSGEIRKVKSSCAASVGQLSNPDHMNVRLGKAGRKRHRGIRPTVRGKVMNPVDHPHGGGEGVNPIGLDYPKTPWGKHALGVKTRRLKKGSSTFILKRRGGK